MEQPNDSLLTPSSGSNNRFDEIRKLIVFLQTKRTHLCSIEFKGKDQGRDAWHLVLVDWEKKELFFERAGEELEAKNYGKIVASGWGGDIPNSEYDKIKKFLKCLEKQLFIFQLQTNKELFYVLCDADKKSEIIASRTAEEVGRCGKILYSSMDEDPQEALYDVIEKGYFGSSEESGSVILTESGIKSSRGGREDNIRGLAIARRADILEIRDFLKEVGNVDWSDENGWTMLHHAAFCGDLNMIRILKDMNANTLVRENICDRKPIHIAAREGHTRAVELLLIDSDRVNDIDKSGWTPLHYATWKGKSDTVQYLISKNANTEIRDKCLGKKPIHVAATEGHTDIVRIFLDNDGNIDDSDVEDRTLLYYAAYAGRFETTKFLIDRNANVDMSNKFGAKPIHVASYCDLAQVAELLLSHGSDIESRDHKGRTPLHWATDCGGVKVVQMLVEKGAKLNATDVEGNTPFDLAIILQNLEKASYLAEIMCERFKDNDVLEIYEKLFKIQKEILGHDHFQTLKTQSNIALMLYKLERYEEALKMFNVISTKRQAILGVRHFDTLCSKYEMGRVYVAQWKLDEALDIYEEVYKSWQDELGTHHHRTLSVAREIAFVHFKKREYDEAFAVFEDIYEKRTQSSDVNDPVTLQALEDMAIVLINKGENENALQILEDVFSKRKECLGVNHPDTLSTGYHKAEVEKRLKNTKERASSYSKVVNLFRK